MVLIFYEATSTFTFVTTRIVAHPPLCGLCRWASEGNVSLTPCHPSYMALASTMMGLAPIRLRYPSLGTLKMKELTPT
jgi:hypothetical protein